MTTSDWTVKLIDDKYAYAEFRRPNGERIFKCVELKDYAYHAEAIRAAVDSVLEQMASI